MKRADEHLLAHQKQPKCLQYDVIGFLDFAGRFEDSMGGHGASQFTGFHVFCGMTGNGDIIRSKKNLLLILCVLIMG